MVLFPFLYFGVEKEPHVSTGCKIRYLCLVNGGFGGKRTMFQMVAKAVSFKEPYPSARRLLGGVPRPSRPWRTSARNPREL